MERPKVFCLRAEKHEFNTISYHKCEDLSPGEGNQCTDEVTRRNKIIDRWNSLVRDCKPGNTNSVLRPPTSSPGGGNDGTHSAPPAEESALSRARKEVEKEAENADEKNRQAEDLLKQSRKAKERNEQLAIELQRKEKLREQIEADRQRADAARKQNAALVKCTYDKEIWDGRCYGNVNTPLGLRITEVCFAQSFAASEHCRAEALGDPDAIRQAKIGVGMAQQKFNSLASDIRNGVYQEPADDGNTDSGSASINGVLNGSNSVPPSGGRRQYGPVAPPPPPSYTPPPPPSPAPPHQSSGPCPQGWRAGTCEGTR